MTYNICICFSHTIAVFLDQKELSKLILASDGLTRTTCADRKEWELSLLGGGEKPSLSAVVGARSARNAPRRARRGGRRRQMALSHSTQLESEARKGLSRPLALSLGDLVFEFAEY